MIQIVVTATVLIKPDGVTDLLELEALDFNL